MILELYIDVDYREFKKKKPFDIGPNFYFTTNKIYTNSFSIT